jgi:hypothetical protein
MSKEDGSSHVDLESAWAGAQAEKPDRDTAYKIGMEMEKQTDPEAKKFLGRSKKLMAQNAQRKGEQAIAEEEDKNNHEEGMFNGK